MNDSCSVQNATHRTLLQSPRMFDHARTTMPMLPCKTLHNNWHNHMVSRMWSAETHDGTDQLAVALDSVNRSWYRLAISGQSILSFCSSCASFFGCFGLTFLIITFLPGRVRMCLRFSCINSICMCCSSLRRCHCLVSR